MFKRVLALFVSFAMVFSLLPVGAFATETEGTEPDVTVTEVPATEAEQTPAEDTEASVPETTDSAEAPEEDAGDLRLVWENGDPVTVVNPRYADVLSAEDLEFASASVQFLDEPVFITEAEAVQTLRQAMVYRADQVTLYVKSRNADCGGLVYQMLDSSMQHTSNPVEGDYLAYQFSGYSCQPGVWQYEDGSLFVDEDGYYHYSYSFAFDYYDTADQQDAVDAAVSALLNQLNLYGKSDYEKLCGIYDWMCANITYDDANLENDSYTLKYTAYAALIDRTAVCQGYANLFYRLALELDVDSRIISGIGNGGAHAWNIVKLGSKYYDCDATWDAVYRQAGLEYNWFIKNEADFSADHARNAEFATAAFSAAYPMAEADYVYFGQEEFDNAVVEKNGQLTEDIIITGDVVFNGASPMIYADESRYITIADGGSLTIAGGSFLTFNENISVIVENGGKLVAEPGSFLIKIGNGGITIKKGGTLTTTGAGDLFVSDLSSFTVESGANVNIDVVRINIGATVSGVDNEQIRMSNIAVSSAADLQAALATYSDYAGMDIYTTGSFELTENLVIPAGTFLSIEAQITVTVARGVTLVNEGEIWIYSEGTLVNNGTFENTGKLELQGGTFIDNSTEELPYFGQEEFDAILVEQDGFYYMAQDVIITGDVTFSSGDLMLLAHNGPQARHIVIAEGGSLTISGESFVAVQNGGSITVENGGELTMDTDTYLRIMNDCSLTVKDGGVLNACDAIVYVTAAGNMAVESGAVLNLDQVITNPGSNITGVALSEIRMADIMVSNVAELNAAIAEYADYAGLEVYSMGFTFDQDATIPANVVFGVAMNTTATVNAGVTLTNNGNLLIVGTLVNNGIIDGTGSMEITTEGSFVDNSSGIPTFVSVYTEQELMDALADGEKFITIAADMEINADLQMFDVTVRVDTGVTVTLNKGLYMNPKTNVMAGGKLILNGELNVEGMLTVEDELVNNGALWINHNGELYVIHNASLTNNGDFHIGFGDPEQAFTSELMVYGCVENCGYFNVTDKGAVYISGNFENKMTDDNAGFVEIHGEMNVSGGLNNISPAGISLDGTLNVTGTYSGWGVVAVNAANDNVVLNGVGYPADVQYHYGVGSIGEMKDAITEAQSRAYLYIDVYGSFDIDQNIVLPDNVYVCLAGSADAPVTVTVLPGVTLTNAHSGLSIEENATLLIAEGATFCNNGDTSVRGGTLNVAGNYTSDYEDMMISVDLYRRGEVIGAASCFIVDVEYIEQLWDAMKAAAQVEAAVEIKLRSTLSLNQDLVIPANVRLSVISDPGNEVLMIVPYGVTLINNGVLNFSASQLTVQSGGAMENCGIMQFNAAPLGTGGGFFAGTFNNKGDAWFNTGAFLNVSGTVTNEGNFHVGFGDGQISEVTITGSFNNCSYLNLTEYAYVSVSGQLYNNSKPETWAQIDLRGQMEVPGCLYNYSDITVWGQLIVSGEMVNQGMISVDSGMLNVEGTYEGTGEMQMHCEYGQINVSGVPNGSINAHFAYVTDAQTLVNALTAGYNEAYVVITGNIVLSDSLTVPAGSSLHIADFRTDTAVYSRSIAAQSTCASLTVPEGKTLTVEGSLTNEGNVIIAPEAVLVNKEEAIIENTGSLIVEEAASVVNEGELVNGGSVVVEEAATMVNEGALVNSGSVVVEANAALNNSGTIEVNDNGAVIVQSQGQINNNGDLVVNDGELSVEEGGVLEGNRPEGVYAAMVNGVDYETFAQALTAAGEGDTVQLLKDIAETEIRVGEGITLDLNGHILTAEYVFAVNGSNIVDSSEGNTGLLKVAADCIAVSKTNAQLPVGTGEGYIFIDLQNFQEMYTANEMGHKQYIFSPSFESVAHQYLAQGKENSGFRISIRMTWKSGSGSASQNFVFQDKTVKTIVESFNGSWYTQAFYVTVTNAEAVDYTIQVSLISDTGMELVCN